MSETVDKNLDIHIRAKDEASNVVGSAFESLKAKAKSLNQEARSSGDLALERLLRGGGFLGIFTLAGDALKKVTGEMIKLSEELEKGKINAADVALEFGKSIPVLGGVFEAGENINELLTHQKANIEHVNEEIKASNALMDLRVKQQKESIKQEEELADRIRKTANELRLAQAKPQDKKDVQAGNELAEQKATVAKELKKAEDQAKENLAKQLEAIRKEGEARKQVLRDQVSSRPLPVGKNRYDALAQQDKELDQANLQAQIEESNNETHAIEQNAKELAKIRAQLATEAANAEKTIRQKSLNESIAADNERAKKLIESSLKTFREFADRSLSPKDDKLADDTSEALAKAKEDQLRISGQALEADLLQLKTAHEKRLAEIRREAQEEVKARPAEARKIRAEQGMAENAENDSYQGDVAKAKSDAARSEAETHGKIQEQLARGKIDYLQKEAELGDAAAARELERLKIAEDFARRKAEILKLTQGASEADRAALTAEAAALDAQQRKATIFALLKPQLEELSRPTRNAGFEDFRKTQGIADAQRERDRGNQVSQLEQLMALVKHAQAISGKLDPLVSQANTDAGSSGWDPSLQ